MKTITKHYIDGAFVESHVHEVIRDRGVLEPRAILEEC